MSNIQTLTFKRTIQRDAAAIYGAFTNAMRLREWLCNGSTVNAQVNGPLLLQWNQGYYAAGHFTELDKDAKIGFTWFGLGDPRPSQVEVTIKPNGGGTDVTVTHTDVGSDDGWKTTVEQLTQGWEMGMNNLKSVLESGEDLRLTQGVILGVYPTAFLNPDLIEQLGVPIETGMVISGTVPDTPVAQAGLTANDVIYRLNGVDIVRGVDMATALAGKEPDDSVELVYYRGAEKHTITVQPVKRPMPTVPETVAELVQQMRDAYAALNTELEDLVKDIGEDEASQKPDENNWSVKDNLGHLIWVERYSHFYLWGLLGGNDLVPFPDNGHIQQTVSLHGDPTLAETVDRLKQERGATLAILDKIPESFPTEHPGSYTRIAIGVISSPQHDRIHHQQIQDTLKTIRGQ